MSKQRKAKLMSLGLGGNSVEYGEHCHGSWYLHDVEEIAKHYAHELEPGVLLLDKRPALENTCAPAFASPMVNVDMEPGAVDDFGSRYLSQEGGGIMMQAMREHPQSGAIIQAAKIVQDAGISPGPLDYVDTLTYCRWWCDRGAVVYRYDGSAFVLMEGGGCNAVA